MVELGCRLCTLQVRLPFCQIRAILPSRKGGPIREMLFITLKAASLHADTLPSRECLLDVIFSGSMRPEVLILVVVSVTTSFTSCSGSQQDVALVVVRHQF